MYKSINPTKALIFRITHRENVPWILQHRLHCRNGGGRDPKFVQIGNSDLIDKRQHRMVEIPPGGTLSDYIPFYFTPLSPMLYNIKSGWAGIRQRANDEIVMLVSSLHRLSQENVPFVFTDRHAYLLAAEMYSGMDHLDKIDWKILQNRDFRRDPNDPEKVERYQAEALVYRMMPTTSLLGIACYTQNVADDLSKRAEGLKVALKVIVKQEWYFS